MDDSQSTPLNLPFDTAVEAPTALPPLPAEQSAWLRMRTPARIALRRSGVSLATPEVLDFQLAHDRARDAVHATLQHASLRLQLQSLPAAFHAPLFLHSEAENRAAYLQRPDLGRKLNTASFQRLTEYASTLDTAAGAPAYDVAFVLADGLSALAVERHAAPLLAELLPMLQSTEPHLRLGPLCIVEQARVAVGDAVAQALSAGLVIVLIGERPGLSSPDSLGAYITWNPQPGVTTDAGRNCISNIRQEGLSYPQAATRLLYYIREARSRQTTGVALKDPDIPLELTALAGEQP